MERILEILLFHGWISKKQKRDILSLRLKSVGELENYLRQNNLIDPPDWEDAKVHISEDQSKDDSPLSTNKAILNLLETSKKVAKTDTTVLILGESGTGKSRLAKHIHQESFRAKGPWVTVSCGSIPENLIESELFGAKRGSFTGAVRDIIGRFEKADEGTLFLDEIGELPLHLQVKLLRVLQDRKIEPIGGVQEKTVNVRIIAATNRDLKQSVELGTFREDLYFRLSVVPIELPPLRDRVEDILPLSEFILKRLSDKFGKSFRLSDTDLTEALVRHKWPGNIRELENCLERLAVLSEDGTLHSDALPDNILKRKAKPTLLQSPNGFLSLAEVEKTHIERALERSRGKINAAAEMLQLHRNTLSRKVQEYGLELDDYRKPRE